jgi:predicted nuclease of predicted toxin-antitoxin system
VKILIDMNLSPQWREVLRSAGHEVRHWSEIGAHNADDTVIMEWARVHGFIVFTNDLDYGALLYSTGAVAPSVIQARADDVRPTALSGAIAVVLLEAEEALLAGALVTVDMRRHRVSILPLRRCS